MPEFRIPGTGTMPLAIEEIAKAVANSDPLVDPVMLTDENGVLCVAIPVATYHKLLALTFPPKTVAPPPEPHVRRST